MEGVWKTYMPRLLLLLLLLPLRRKPPYSLLRCIIHTFLECACGWKAE